MQRFYRLTVDRLEDRWVPSTVTDTTNIVATPVTTDSTQFVIDVSSTPIVVDTSVSTTPTVDNSVDISQPIDNPFWY